MFPITIMQCDNAELLATTLRESFMKCGDISQLGAGCFGAVYGSGNHNHVVKVTFGNDWGYLTYLELIKKRGKGNPWVPRIHMVEVHMDDAGGTVVIADMERLSAVYTHDQSHVHEETLYKVAAHIKGRGDFPLVKTNGQLRRAVDIVREAHRRSGCGYDLHSGNFMMRKDQLVITDPLSYPS